MVDDIIFESGYFFLEITTEVVESAGFIEAESSYFPLRLALPERISIG